VASAVANGGTLARPHLVDRTTTADGRLVARVSPPSSARVMTARTARLLRDMMVDAVEEGTGADAALDDAVVGGKTGTAQHGPGNAGTPYAWFVSRAQRHDAPRPAVAVAVVVEDAEADRADISGGGDAAPVARAVMAAALPSGWAEP
jgi:penicillin-binding protein A